MQDDDLPRKRAPTEPEALSSSRKPYDPPRLTELGSLAQLTRGGDQEQRGEGPGFSL
jgi:hypothetical protein